MTTVENSIVEWLNSFENLGIHLDHLTELANGVHLFKILQEVSREIWKESDMEMEDSDNELAQMKNVS